MMQIPLFSDRSYNYTILLNETYWRLHFLYNPRSSQWNFTIEVDATEEIILSNEPMGAGVDLLHQYRPIGNRFGKLLLWNEEDPTEEMDFTNVDSFSLYYLLPDEEIPSRFDLISTPVIERECIVSKTVYPGWTPS